MTLDEVLTIANKVYHLEVTNIEERSAAFGYIWTNADQLRRAHKLKEVEARCAALLSENDALEAENTKLDDELTETKRALSDLMNELRELKSR